MEDDAKDWKSEPGWQRIDRLFKFAHAAGSVESKDDVDACFRRICDELNKMTNA